MRENIIFLWHEIPAYAAYQLNYIIKKSPHNIYVITNNIISKQIKKILNKNISQKKKLIRLF